MGLLTDTNPKYNECLRRTQATNTVTEIHTVEQARKQKERREFERERDAFRAEVRDEIEGLRNCGDDERELNDFFISEYEGLLKMPIDCESDLAHVEWLYNYGNLRASNEIYVHSGRFKSDCNKRTYGLPYCLFIAGYLTALIPFMKYWYDPYALNISLFIGFVGGSVLGCLLGGILGLIGCWIGESINKHKADCMIEQGVHEAAPMAERARTNLAVTATASVAAAAGIGRSIRKNTREFMNVDGWKQMK